MRDIWDAKIYIMHGSGFSCSRDTIAILNVALFLFGSNPTTLELGMRTSAKGAFEEFK